MPQKNYFYIEIVGGSNISYGYLKKMFYQHRKYQITSSPNAAKKYRTFEEAAADVDILVSFNISIRALIHNNMYA